MNQIHTSHSTENTAEVLVRQKSSEVATSRKALGDHSNSQGPTKPRVKTQGCQLVVPRQRFGATRSASSASSKRFDSVSSLNSIPEVVGVKSVEDIDKDDDVNAQLVAAYVKDVYVYLRGLEVTFSIKPNYMTAQAAKPEVSPRMRCILVDWLLQVHNRFALLQETLFLTIGILDRYLQEKVHHIGRKHLQLVGITCMWIAAKYEEIYAPEVNDFVHITDNAYTSGEMRKMELDILRTLDFNLGRPLALHFLRRNSKAGEVDAMQHALAKFFMEVTLQEYSFAHVAPSLVAAAALWLGVKLEAPHSAMEWSEKMVHYSGYSEQDVMPYAVDIAGLVVKLPNSKTNYVYTKYQSSKYMKISNSSCISGPTIRKIASNCI